MKVTLPSVNTLANITLATTFNIIYAALLFTLYFTDNRLGLNIALATTVLLFTCFSLMALFTHRFATHHAQQPTQPFTQPTQTLQQPQTDSLKNREEAATLAKMAFLDTINHEIRTPLNGILGLTSLLMDTRQTAEQRKYIENIKLSGEALLKAITELASFSKIKTSSPDQKPLPTQKFAESSFSSTAPEITITPQEERILLAEDNPISQLVAQTMLKKLGFKNIDIANNGAEALKSLQKNNYDLIFMDCEMPEMDGYTASRKIRETNKNIPIVAMTAHTAEGDQELCFESGMNDYMSKPIDRKTLVRTLTQWLPQDTQ